jgi:hypothetical protein
MTLPHRERSALGALRPAALLSAVVLLCPLYWQIHFMAPMLLLAVGQALIACCAVNTLRKQRFFCRQFSPEDWQRCDSGDYVLELSAQQHGKGPRPQIDVYQEEPLQPDALEPCFRIVDTCGNIRLFSATPLRGTVEIRSNPGFKRRAAVLRRSSHHLSIVNDRPDASFRVDP